MKKILFKTALPALLLITCFMLQACGETPPMTTAEITSCIAGLKLNNSETINYDNSHYYFSGSNSDLFLCYQEYDKNDTTIYLKQEENGSWTEFTPSATGKFYNADGLTMGTFAQISTVETYYVKNESGTVYYDSSKGQYLEYFKPNPSYNSMSESSCPATADCLYSTLKDSSNNSINGFLQDTQYYTYSNHIYTPAFKFFPELDYRIKVSNDSISTTPDNDVPELYEPLSKTFVDPADSSLTIDIKVMEIINNRVESETGAPMKFFVEGRYLWNENDANLTSEIDTTERDLYGNEIFRPGNYYYGETESYEYIKCCSVGEDASEVNYNCFSANGEYFTKSGDNYYPVSLSQYGYFIKDISRKYIEFSVDFNVTYYDISHNAIINNFEKDVNYYTFEGSNYICAGVLFPSSNNYYTFNSVSNSFDSYTGNTFDNNTTYFVDNNLGTSSPFIRVSYLERGQSYYAANSDSPSSEDDYTESIVFANDTDYYVGKRILDKVNYKKQKFDTLQYYTKIGDKYYYITCKYENSYELNNTGTKYYQEERYEITKEEKDREIEQQKQGLIDQIKLVCLENEENKQKVINLYGTNAYYYNISGENSGGKDIAINYSTIISSYTFNSVQIGLSNEDITLYNILADATIKIYINDDGSFNSFTYSVKINPDFAVANNMSLVDYTSGGGNCQNGAGPAVNSNYTGTAVTETSVTLKPVVTGQDIPETVILSSSNITLANIVPSNATMATYDVPGVFTFTGEWYFDNDFKNRVPATFKVGSKDSIVCLYPKYTINTPITYNLDGGLLLSSTPTNSNTLRDYTFIRAYKPGYIFDGWSSTENGDVLTSTNVVIDGNLSTLYAQYTKLTTISFDTKCNVKLGHIVVDRVSLGSESVQLPTNFYRSGYVFDGWSLTEGGAIIENSLLDLSSVTETDITLYANFKEALTITFHHNINQGLTTTTAFSIKKLDEDATPEEKELAFNELYPELVEAFGGNISGMSSLSFVGFYTDSALTNKLSTYPTSSSDLYPKYVENLSMSFYFNIETFNTDDDDPDGNNDSTYNTSSDFSISNNGYFGADGEFILDNQNQMSLGNDIVVSYKTLWDGDPYSLYSAIKNKIYFSSNVNGFYKYLVVNEIYIGNSLVPENIILSDDDIDWASFNSDTEFFLVFTETSTNPNQNP